MTVAELIAELSTLDPQFRVLMPGYEEGYDDVLGVSEPFEIRLDVHDDDWRGKHVRANDGPYDERAVTIF